MFSARKLVAALSLLAILIAATSSLAPALFYALVVPILFFVAALVPAPLRREAEGLHIPPFPCLSVVACRAPPSAWPADV